ncbi:MAG: hypothetical protein IIX40_02670 [Alistipes sp.]|nr:hypothetical protein [Alistipes sp.]
MKTFTKLFVVIVALFAYACATDTTEDLGINLNGSKSEISLSLEGTKVHIGDKVGQEYPLYWSEGDKIAVNGIASQPLAAEAHGQTSATFAVEGTLEYPYNIVYPAPAEGAVAATEGQQVVSFLAAQPYTAGTFAEGSTPLYAQVGAAGEAISLNHLAGVLRFAPKGEGVTLTSLVITSEIGKIAGNFDVDCATGTLTAHSDATNSVTVSFGEGLALGAEATPIYVAIPAGLYGTFAITLNTATDSMLVKFNAGGEMAVKAGVVREFGEFTYAASPVENEIFEIYDEASLRKFAEIAPTFYPRKGAKLMNDIDLTGKEWITIEGFGAYEFDGNGKKIIGLSAPLFGTTNAHIKNLHLENLDLNITDARHVVGGIACVLQSTADATAKLDGCTVSGKVTFATTYAASTQKDEEMAVSPMVAQSFGAQITNCQNNASITVTAASASTTKNTYMCVAGIVGYATGIADLGIIPILTNCVNNESATILWEEGTVSSAKHSPYIAGVVGRYLTSSGLSNCTNHADVTVKSNINVANIGGVCGYIYVNETSKLYNYGDVTLDAKTAYAYWGGVIGSCYTSTMSVTECENHGKVEFGANASCTQRNYIGGIIGTSQSSGATYSNLKNTGTIASYGSNNGCRFFTGGIIGYCWKVGELSNSVNGVEGDATKGKIIIKGTVGTTIADGDPVYYPCIGGVVGNFYPNGGAYLLKGCTNYGPISFGFTTSGNQNYNLGGVAGYAQGAASENCHNYGAIDCSELNNVGHKQLLIGGVVGYSTKASNGCSNSGAITLGTEADGRIQLGGVIGYQLKDVTNCSNSGDIIINSAIGIANPSVAKVRGNSVANRSDYDLNNRSNVGGVIGKFYDTKGTVTLSTLKNTGDISFPQADSLNCAAIAGILGEATVVSITITNSENEGNISVANTNAEAALVHFGGILGRNYNKSISSMTINITDCSNKGNITLTEKEAIRHARAGGIIGDLISAGSSKFETIVNVTNCTNSGNISRTTQTKAEYESFAGGIVGSVGVSPANADESLMATELTITNCTNSGGVQFGQYKGESVLDTSWSRNAVGGIIGMIYGGKTNNSKLYTPTLVGCRNKGTIQARGGAVGGLVGLIKDWAHIVGTADNYNVNEGEVILEVTANGFVGGVIGYIEEGDHTNCDIQVSHCANKGKITGHYRVGGIIGTSTTTNNEAIKDCVNIGYIKNNKVDDKATTVGGIVGKATSFITNCKSHCQIEAHNCLYGMITAGERTETTLVKDCQVGGVILGEYDTEDEAFKEETIKSTNFYDYIYGTGKDTDWTGTDNYDGNTHLSKKPTVN